VVPLRGHSPGAVHFGRQGCGSPTVHCTSTPTRGGSEHWRHRDQSHPRFPTPAEKKLLLRRLKFWHPWDQTKDDLYITLPNTYISQCNMFLSLPSLFSKDKSKLISSPCYLCVFISYRC
jgi:hypothetical protein